MINVYEQIDRNKLRSVVVVTLFFLFVGAFVYILGRAFNYGPSFIGAALIFSGISSFVGYWYSDKIVLGISGARPANKNEDLLFASVAENISIGANIPLPKLYVIDDSAPNAFATGRDYDHAVVCVTSGLLDKLNRTELEGVIAHEYSHIKNYDMLLMSVVSVLVGMITLVGDWLLRVRVRNRDSNGGNTGAILFLLGVILALLSPVIAKLIQLSISRRREFLADAGSVMITRQPSGLIGALKKISADQEPLEAANKATAHLYFARPFKNRQRNISWFAGMFNTHPPVTERIKALEGLA